MRYTLAFLLLLFALPLEARVTEGTFTGNGSSEWVTIRGGGVLFIDDDTGNGFGGGTLTLEVRQPDDTALPVESYTTAPAPNGVTLWPGGSDIVVRVTLAGSTAPTLYWWITTD